MASLNKEELNKQLSMDEQELNNITKKPNGLLERIKDLETYTNKLIVDLKEAKTHTNKAYNDFNKYDKSTSKYSTDKRNELKQAINEIDNFIKKLQIVADSATEQKAHVIARKQILENEIKDIKLKLQQ